MNEDITFCDNEGCPFEVCKIHPGRDTTASCGLHFYEFCLYWQMKKVYEAFDKFYGEGETSDGSEKDRQYDDQAAQN